MKCPRCRHENPSQPKFCESAPHPARTYTNCGRQLSATAKSCPQCAHPASPAGPAATAQRFISSEFYTPKHLEKILTSKSALEGKRKQVTVLFADLKAQWSLLAFNSSSAPRVLLLDGSA
jgi:hypothetical protein